MLRFHRLQPVVDGIGAGGFGLAFDRGWGPASDGTGGPSLDQMTNKIWTDRWKSFGRTHGLMDGLRIHRLHFVVDGGAIYYTTLIYST